MTPLADLIRAARLAAEITQEELAARCRAAGHTKVLRETVARAEKVGPREPTLRAICDGLGLDVVLVRRAAKKGS